MKRKQIKIEFLLPVMAALLAIGGGGIILRPAENPDQTLPARFGDVVWNHELHARMKDMKCSQCHHTDKQGVTNPKPCRDCHALPDKSEALILADVFIKDADTAEAAAPGGDGQGGADQPEGQQGPPAMDAFHAKCAGCHKSVNQGPVGCRDCHAQQFTGSHGVVSWSHREHSRRMDRIECVDCHHQDQDAKTDADYRACGVCHKPAVTMDADMETGLAEHEDETHFTCWFCHTVSDPEVGVASCTECHPDMDPNPPGTSDENKVPPSLEQAIHGKCLECHNAYDPDLRPSMPGVCADCHKSPTSLFPGDRAGPAVWSHTRHSKLVDWTCDQCHHNDPPDPDKPHLACWRCHGRDDFQGIPKYEDAVHKRCIDCHEEKEMGPLDCLGCHGEDKKSLELFKGESARGVVWWNHVFHLEDMSFSCRDCHHNTMKKDGFAFTACASALACPEEAGDPRSCVKCHERAQVQSMTTMKSPAPPPGAAGPDGKLPAAPLGNAMNGSCIECHQRFGAGPTKCEECHVQ